MPRELRVRTHPSPTHDPLPLARRASPSSHGKHQFAFDNVVAVSKPSDTGAGTHKRFIHPGDPGYEEMTASAPMNDNNDMTMDDDPLHLLSPLTPCSELSDQDPPADPTGVVNSETESAFDPFDYPRAIDGVAKPPTRPELASLERKMFFVDGRNRNRGSDWQSTQDANSQVAPEENPRTPGRDLNYDGGEPQTPYRPSASRAPALAAAPQEGAHKVAKLHGFNGAIMPFVPYASSPYTTPSWRHLSDPRLAPRLLGPCSPERREPESLEDDMLDIDDTRSESTIRQGKTGNSAQSALEVAQALHLASRHRPRIITPPMPFPINSECSFNGLRGLGDDNDQVDSRHDQITNRLGTTARASASLSTQLRLLPQAPPPAKFVVQWVHDQEKRQLNGGSMDGDWE